MDRTVGLRATDGTPKPWPWPPTTTPFLRCAAGSAPLPARWFAAGGCWTNRSRSGSSSASPPTLLKNPEDLTEKQSRKLAVIAQVNDPLYRAYLLKEQLRMIFRVRYEQAQVGSPLPHRAPRQAGADYHLLPPGHRGDAAPWGQQRKLGVGQHEDPLDRPESFRVSLRQGADRALRAHARRAMPVTAWPPVSYPRMCQKNP
jgi:Transposase